VPTRVGTPGSSVSFGVRPEKAHAVPAEPGTRDPALRNAIPGTVTDVSFTGLSTQYVVRTSWDAELGVFTQNAGGEAPVRPGDAVLVAWRPEHTFPLADGAGQEAGEPDDEPAGSPTMAPLVS
jgi:spermidine/putrescine transport system ATP-binding protein